MVSGSYGQADGTGRLLAGRYRVVARLGRGGMGVVWRAVDEVLGREVAVKELRAYTDSAGPELADLRLRMQREARAAARVRHRGVVVVHDIAEVDGRPLIVMELVDGPSLDDLLRERGTLGAQEAARVGAEVMDALAAAHRAGVLHRDVKPGNILLDRSGRVVLTDFGIATMADPGDGSATHLTGSGELVGSLDYLAPERAKGVAPGPASDVWALGAALYAAVEGASPFHRTSTFSTLTAIVDEPLPEPRRAGPLAPVLRRLMDKRPDARPDAEEACGLLRTVAREPVGDTPTTALREPARPGTDAGAPVASPGRGSVGGADKGLDEGPDDGAGEVSDDGLAQEAGQGADRERVQGAVEGPVHGLAQGSAQGPAPEPVGQLAPVPAAGLAQGAGTPGSGLVAARRLAPAPRPGAPDSPMSPTGPIRTRRRVRTLVVVAVAVVLTATGLTVALRNDRGQTAKTDAGPPAPTVAGASESVRGTGAGRTADADPVGQGEETGAVPATGATHAAGGDPADPAERASATPSSAQTAGHSPSGGSGSVGATAPATATADAPTTPAPVCRSAGDGTYTCLVRNGGAKSYTADGVKVGKVRQGAHSFYCQVDLGRRETHGQRTNVWWAETDDDKGNTGVYISDVYIKGGTNDEPLPGLPVC
ncbi:serine/threonine-protein kinase [Streptomyces sp. GbtcB6]|uniref:serine/threonine-protein kinase n=1 Tax=Streptomyces sp. GbtcB6 TaxID=2824751 RepID=UPI001C2F550C|nr:serine/threonine-protein kinase [Streptomyces sp. GbtcB6]